MMPNFLALILSSHFLQQVMVLGSGQTEQREANRPLKYAVPVHHCWQARVQLPQVQDCDATFSSENTSMPLVECRCGTK